MKRMLVSLFLLTVIVLSGCGADPSAANPLDGTSWELSMIAGRSPAPGSTVTLEFREGQASGSAGCNGYGGDYAVEGEEIIFEEVASTLILCSEPEGVMEQEAEFLGSLNEVERFELDEEQLRLFRADGEALVFVPAP